MNDQALDIADALEQSHQFDISKIVEMLRYQHSEIERLNQCLIWEQNRAEHVGTHGPGCAEWGPRHYECLLRAYDALKERTSQESRQVEPVAYMSLCFSNGQTKPHSKTLFFPEQYTGRTEPVSVGAWGEERVVPLYAAPPKREPLTNAEIERLIYENTKINPNVADDKELLGYIVNAVRAIERAHGIGGEE